MKVKKKIRSFTITIASLFTFILLFAALGFKNAAGGFGPNHFFAALQRKSENKIVYKSVDPHIDLNLELDLNGTFSLIVHDASPARRFSAGYWEQKENIIIIHSDKELFYNHLLLKFPDKSTAAKYRYLSVCKRLELHNDSLFHLGNCDLAPQISYDNALFDSSGSSFICQNINDNFEIRPICSGQVIRQTEFSVLIRHIEYTTTYYNLDSVFVNNGQIVDTSDIIGLADNKKMSYVKLDENKKIPLSDADSIENCDYRIYFAKW